MSAVERTARGRGWLVRMWSRFVSWPDDSCNMFFASVLFVGALLFTDVRAVTISFWLLGAAIYYRLGKNPVQMHIHGKVSVHPRPGGSE